VKNRHAQSVVLWSVTTMSKWENMTDEEQREYERILGKRLLLASVAFAGDDPAKLPSEHQLTDAENAFYQKWIVPRTMWATEQFIREQENN